MPYSTTERSFHLGTSLRHWRPRRVVCRLHFFGRSPWTIVFASTTIIFTWACGLGQPQPRCAAPHRHEYRTSGTVSLSSLSVSFSLSLFLTPLTD